VRARREVTHDRRRFEASGPAQMALVNRFLVAARSGDLSGLEELLAQDVGLHADGGGKVRAIVRPIFGRSKVARAVLRYVDVALGFGGFTVETVEINGHPGAMGVTDDGRVLFVLSLDILDGQIQSIRSIANPDKLAHLRPG
jgi:ketosteroid isomerase-like protein